MIGLVIVTHGGLAVEFRAALEHVVGPQAQLETVSIGPEDDMSQRRADILAAVKRADSGAGVVVLTDMFGGTPSNLAISVMDEAKVEVIAGINLPVAVLEKIYFRNAEKLLGVTLPQKALPPSPLPAAAAALS